MFLSVVSDETDRRNPKNNARGGGGEINTYHDKFTDVYEELRRLKSGRKISMQSV